MSEFTTDCSHQLTTVDGRVALPAGGACEKKRVTKLLLEKKTGKTLQEFCLPILPVEATLLAMVVPGIAIRVLLTSGSPEQSPRPARGDVLGYGAGRGKPVDDRDIRPQIRGNGKAGCQRVALCRSPRELVTR